MIEAYPHLSSLENIASLQEEIASTENRIAFARQHYNDTAAALNLAKDQFPASFFLRNAERAEYWQVPEGADIVPSARLAVGARVA